MKSHYREKKILSGDFLEVEIYPVYEHPTARRGKRNKPSTEVQKVLNRKNAQKKLTRTINTNFTDGDLMITADYDDYHLPHSDEEWQKDIRNYLKRIKYRRNKRNLPELKYIVVYEKGKTTGRMHTHIIMNAGLSRDELEELWGKGRANCKRLQKNELGLSEIAGYISKDPCGTRRWSPSKNLKEPEVHQNDYKYTKRKAREVGESFQDREYFEKLYPGYCFLDCGSFYNDINGGIYVEIKMIKYHERRKPYDRKRIE